MDDMVHYIRAGLLNAVSYAFITPLRALLDMFDANAEDRETRYTRVFLIKLMDRYQKDMYASSGRSSKQHLWQSATFQDNLTLCNMLQQQGFGVKVSEYGHANPYYILNRLLETTKQHQQQSSTQQQQHCHKRRSVRLQPVAYHDDVAWLLRDSAVDVLPRLLSHLRLTESVDVKKTYKEESDRFGKGYDTKLGKLIDDMSQYEAKVEGGFETLKETTGMWTENTITARVLNDVTAERDRLANMDHLNTVTYSELKQQLAELIKTYENDRDVWEIDLSTTIHEYNVREWIYGMFGSNLHDTICRFQGRYRDAVTSLEMPGLHELEAIDVIEQMWDNALTDMSTTLSNRGGSSYHSQPTSPARDVYVNKLVQHSFATSMVTYLCKVRSVLPGVFSSSEGWREKVVAIDAQECVKCSDRTYDFLDQERVDAASTESIIEHEILSEWKAKSDKLVYRLQLLQKMLTNRYKHWHNHKEIEFVQSLIDARVEKCCQGISASDRIPYGWWDKLYHSIPSHAVLVDWWGKADGDDDKNRVLLKRLSKREEDSVQQFVSWTEVQTTLILLQWAASALEL